MNFKKIEVQIDLLKKLIHQKDYKNKNQISEELVNASLQIYLEELCKKRVHLIRQTQVRRKRSLDKLLKSAEYYQSIPTPVTEPRWWFTKKTDSKKYRIK